MVEPEEKWRDSEILDLALPAEWMRFCLPLGRVCGSFHLRSDGYIILRGMYFFWLFAT